MPSTRSTRADCDRPIISCPAGSRRPPQADWGRACTRSPLRRVRRPPARPRQPGPGGRTGSPARTAGHRTARCPDGGLADGPPRLARTGHFPTAADTERPRAATSACRRRSPGSTGSRRRHGTAAGTCWWSGGSLSGARESGCPPLWATSGMPALPTTPGWHRTARRRWPHCWAARVSMPSGSARPMTATRQPWSGAPGT